MNNRTRTALCIGLFSPAFLSPRAACAADAELWRGLDALKGGGFAVEGEFDDGDAQGLALDLMKTVNEKYKASFKATGTFGPLAFKEALFGKRVFEGKIESGVLSFKGNSSMSDTAAAFGATAISDDSKTEAECSGGLGGTVRLTVNYEEKSYAIEISGESDSCTVNETGSGSVRGPLINADGGMSRRVEGGTETTRHRDSIAGDEMFVDKYAGWGFSVNMPQDMIDEEGWMPLPAKGAAIRGSSKIKAAFSEVHVEPNDRAEARWWMGETPPALSLPCGPEDDPDVETERCSGPDMKKPASAETPGSNP